MYSGSHENNFLIEVRLIKISNLKIWNRKPTESSPACLILDEWRDGNLSDIVEEASVSIWDAIGKLNFITYNIEVVSKRHGIIGAQPCLC